MGPEPDHCVATLTIYLRISVEWVQVGMQKAATEWRPRPDSNRNRWFRKPKLYPVELRGRNGATRLSHASIRGKCWVKPTTALLRILASKFYVCTSTTAQAPDNRHSCACDHGVSNGVPILATSRESSNQGAGTATGTGKPLWACHFAPVIRLG